MVEGLNAMGVRMPREPEGTFYAFASVADLPPPLNDGFGFFRAALREKVITVPGIFFDVRPRGRKPVKSPLGAFVRFSYGPPLAVVNEGLDRIAAMTRRAR
jgi:aspartate/methionine/tyrosine aminotransferase